MKVLFHSNNLIPLHFLPVRIGITVLDADAKCHLKGALCRQTEPICSSYIYLTYTYIFTLRVRGSGLVVVVLPCSFQLEGALVAQVQIRLCVVSPRGCDQQRLFREKLAGAFLVHAAVPGVS